MQFKCYLIKIELIYSSTAIQQTICITSIIINTPKWYTIEPCIKTKI